MAVGWMHAACSTAKDAEQMHNQMTVLSSAAKHVLATMLYNIERQGKGDPQDILNHLRLEIDLEVSLIRSQPEDELEWSGPNTKDGKPL